MKRLLLTLLGALALLVPHAPARAQVVYAQTVSACGTPNNTPVTGNSYPVTQDGTGKLCTSASGGSGSNAAAGPTGSAPPSSASYNGINVGGTLRGQTGVNPSGTVYAGQEDTTSINGVTTLTGAGASGTGSQRVTVAQDPTTIAGSAPGTAGSASANVVTVQGVASMTALTVAQATAANLNMTDAADVAQGSTTSGQVGPLVQCAALTANPTPSTTTTNPLSCTTTGGLRVSLIAQPSAAIIGAVTASASSTNGWTPKLLNALTNTAVAIKTGAGQLGMLQCWNPNATVQYVQIYNIASGSVTVGTSTPLESIPIAPTSTGGFVNNFPGQQFGTAMAIAATTTATGASAPGTALDCNADYN